MLYSARVRAVSLGALSGVLYFLGFAGFGIWPLSFGFMVPLLFALEGRGPKGGFAVGALAGFVAHCGGYYWVVHLLREFAGLPLPLAGLGYVLLNLYQGALFWGLVGAAVAFARGRLGVAMQWSLPVAVMAMEQVFPQLFPSYIAAGFYEVAVLNQVADLGGPVLVDGWVALVSGGIYALVAGSRRENVRLFAAAGAATVFVLGYGAFRLAEVQARVAEAPRLEVAIVQANLGAKDKTVLRQEFLERHQRMSRAAIAERPEVELVVWPEAAFNRAIHRRQTNVRADITPGIDRPVLSGAITVDHRDGERFIFNSVILTSSTGDVRGVFDKVELLAFGETLPFSDVFPGIKRWFPRTGGFDRGTSFQHLELEGGAKLLPMVCYEDLLPRFVRRMWAEAGPAEALVNVTNDSWYGDTHEPRIHLALATLRTIETRRAMIRSTNTGISAIIDPAGRVVARTGQWTQETLFSSVPLLQSPRRTLYQVLGDWPGWTSAAAVLAGLFLARKRKQK